MNTSGFLSKLTEGHNPEQQPEYEYILCKICNHHIETGGYCPDCAAAKDRGYQISELAGRCRTGSDKTGVRWHARVIEGDQVSYKALCGYAPKGLSAGWSDWRPADREVTCPRCLKKLQIANI